MEKRVRTVTDSEEIIVQFHTGRTLVKGVDVREPLFIKCNGTRFRNGHGTHSILDSILDMVEFKGFERLSLDLSGSSFRSLIIRGCTIDSLKLAGPGIGRIDFPDSKFLLNSRIDLPPAALAKLPAMQNIKNEPVGLVTVRVRV